MAPRAYWKGYLELSLGSCPIALFPAASEREKISFHQINAGRRNRNPSTHGAGAGQAGCARTEGRLT
jgi:DNA end-binding protein Ku